MDQLFEAVDDSNLQQVEQLIASGVVDHVDEKEEDTWKSILINLVNSIQYGRQADKIFSQRALVRVLRRSPESPEVYNIPAIMAANYKMADVTLALMLKGGSPTKVNPDFLRSYLARENEGVTPLLTDIAELDAAAHSHGKSFRVYAEEERRSFSLEEVLGRIEGQSGGRRRKTHRRKTHRRKKRVSRRSRK
jgi:hypothetical protein